MTAGSVQRLKVEIQGAVQGVGFRPFVYRLAAELGLAGRVINDSRGVHIEVEAPREVLETFLERLPAEIPPRAILHRLEHAWDEASGHDGFRIEHSEEAGPKTAFVLPDVATCDHCLAEVADAQDRRHRYPFTNCTNCGPRFTIIQALPYDRPNTTMERFSMCPRCSAEYLDPMDRRFHAQPNACPDCGPRLELRGASGASLAREDQALCRAVAGLRGGKILAVKGLGGFLLMLDARDAGVVARLRQRKHRYEKPLALMVKDLAAASELCRVPDAAASLLASPEAPIVLLRRRQSVAVAPAVAPGNPDLGVMLPYTPLHHLLLQAADIPLVATSGNLSDEPIAIGNREAAEKLGGIADLFLLHDRPIARHADDSVVRLLEGAPQMIRRARGYAPLPLTLPRPAPTILAVGGHLKNTVTLAVGEQAFVSQHLGDMETPEARAAFERVIRDFLDLYEAEPAAVAHDLHPDYPTTRWARDAAEGKAGKPAALAGVTLVGVQHHHAHLASCLAEHGRPGPALGVTWDGTGYGTDATVWGGEFLRGNAADFTRAAHLRPFRLPGGEAAVQQPRRTALALLWELEGDAAFERGDLPPVAAFDRSERRLLARMLEQGLNSPVATSAGRLFDAVAALLGLHQRVAFEGQAAMALENASDRSVTGAYPLPLGTTGSTIVLDWGPLIEAVLVDLSRGAATGRVAGRFHNALAAGIVAVAEQIGEGTVALTGGCFQNRLLSERTADRLRRAGFEVLLQRRVPANDGGISLGQIAVAAARLGSP